MMHQVQDTPLEKLEVPSTIGMFKRITLTEIFAKFFFREWGEGEEPDVWYQN